MLKCSQLIHLTNSPPPRFLHTCCAEATMLISPWLRMTIRSLSLCRHKRPCDYSTSCSTPEALYDTVEHRDCSVSQQGRDTLALHSSYLLHTHWTALRLESQYRTSWWSENRKGRKSGQWCKNTQHFFVSTCVCLFECLYIRTESMIPLRAWKPPHTGNTCSTESAIVAS